MGKKNNNDWYIDRTTEMAQQVKEYITRSEVLGSVAGCTWQKERAYTCSFPMTSA